MKKIFFLFVLIGWFGYGIIAHAQSAYYGAQFLNSVDAAFLIKVMNMENQKDSEITNVVYYSQHERQQLNFLDSFLRNPFTQNINALDYNIIQSAFDKYYQASKIQLLYDLDISAQATKVLGFGMQPFKSVTSPAQYQTNLSGTSISLYIAKPYRPNQTAEYMNTFIANGKSLGELRLFFPETYKMLHYSDDSKHEDNNPVFPDFGTTYKQVFTEDLKHVFENVFNYIDNYPANALPELESTFLKEKNISTLKNNENYLPFILSVETLEKVNNGQNPVSLINYLDNKYYATATLLYRQKSTNDKIGIAMHGLNIIQTALRDTCTTYNRKANLWISLEQLNGQKENEKRYFYGLIYQQDITFFNKIFNFNRKTPDSVIVNTLEPYVDAVVGQLTEIQDFINANKGKHDNYRNFLMLNLNLITNNAFMAADMKPYFANSNTLLNIYENNFNHTYSTNVYYTLALLNELQQTKQEFSTEMHKILQHGNFIADIANTNNNEQLIEVIKKYIPKK